MERTKKKAMQPRTCHMEAREVNSKRLLINFKVSRETSQNKYLHSNITVQSVSTKTCGHFLFPLVVQPVILEITGWLSLELKLV